MKAAEVPVDIPDAPSRNLHSSPAFRSAKIRNEHLKKIAIVYVRQSSPQQVVENRESRERQYALADFAQTLGWPADRVLVMYAGRIVEEAPTSELFETPHHPYTRALIRSTPTANVPRGQLPTIPGQVPDLARLPSGCSLHPRCPSKIESCMRSVPPLVVNGDRRLACPVETSA